MEGNALLPKTLKDQKKELRKTTKGQVSIKITKPRLTIGGFKLDPDQVEDAKRSRAKATRSISKEGAGSFMEQQTKT